MHVIFGNGVKSEAAHGWKCRVKRMCTKDKSEAVTTMVPVVKPGFQERLCSIDGPTAP